MMRHLIWWWTTLVLCVVLASPVAADDLNEPNWRGVSNSTLQIWEFSDDDNPAQPEFVENPYGTPEATFYGCTSCIFPDTYWLEEDSGHLGVWALGGSMSLFIPNDPVERPLKMIRLQITYDGGPAPEPMPIMQVIPSVGEAVLIDDSHLVQQLMLDDVYVHDTYDIVLEPNPTDETIWIRPSYCEMRIDQIVVDTLCLSDAAPEPSTLVALLIGAVMCAVCRRRPR